MSTNDHPVNEFLASDRFREYAHSWLPEFQYTLLSMDTTYDVLLNDSVKKKLEFCQRFWEGLPDRAAIRTGAFFELCDYAEEYCFGSDEELDIAE